MEPPPQLLVHLALFCGQAVNGGGSVVAKLGLPTVNPLTFAFFREVCASPLLLALARLHDGPLTLGGRSVVWLLALGTCSLFCNQVLYIVGLKLSNPVLGAAWQPSQPIFTLALARLLGWEALNAWKVLGMLCTLAGGAGMTFLGPNADGAIAGTGSMLHDIISNTLFFGNCLANAVFVLTMRRITIQIPPFTGLALVYSGVTLMLVLFALLVSKLPSVQLFFCPDCTSDFWTFPSGAILALAYWVLGLSVLAYLCLTFGTRHAREPSHCLMYSSLQPVVAGFFAALLIASGWNKRHPDKSLEWLTQGQLLGAALVVLGIAFLAMGTRKQGRDSQPGVQPQIVEARKIGCSIPGHGFTPLEDD